MQKLTSIQKLDLALTILASKDKGLYKQFAVIVMLMTDTGMADTLLILNKLIKDGFAEQKINRIEPDVMKQEYCITFEGLLHSQMGGYIQNQKDKKRERRNLNLVNFCLAVGTALAGLYALTELIKYLVSIPSPRD